MATSQSDTQPQTSGDPFTAGLLDHLREELGKQTAKTIFTCGGTIPITKHEQASGSDDTKISSASSEPVTIRWDPLAPETPASQAKLVLPVAQDDEESLKNLINDLQPASFGYQGKDVFDETYRKALKMDTDKFASTFNPYECGIIDGIAQALLPSNPDFDLRRGVRAELYKLNGRPSFPTRSSSAHHREHRYQVYSSPSGKFKPHVDTPHGSTQFGSLVVCLPLEHEGGQLQVRHKGQEVTYGWGAHRDHISWAAFYSDCEHEVLEFKSGYRLTLTYNLYAVRGGSMLTGVEPPVLDATQLPIYVSLKDIVQNKDFMPQGGYLGFYCNHAYAHTNTEAVILPDMLKGLDMIMWEAFGRLGLEASVKPVMDVEEFYEGLYDYYEENDQVPIPDRDLMVIGNDRALHMSQGLRIEEYDQMDDEIAEWRGDETLKSKEVHWLTKPTHKQVQMAYIAYGNEESLASFYSYYAIIAKVKPSNARSV
ncbi:hypothetical protein DHEL01_v208545 [Diaporthe helianthi]|uniref:Fe2OG dioxygenase domain-containing protein n=1 Tax=Diaporthe helianthi TaxID=158607 RepID=A0A2P5HS22_DIAHE|nr:hypothetical protein DHEL01_v208545 [Diaporthe helianthi]